MKIKLKMPCTPRSSTTPDIQQMLSADSPSVHKIERSRKRKSIDGLESGTIIIQECISAEDYNTESSDILLRSLHILQKNQCLLPVEIDMTRTFIDNLCTTINERHEFDLKSYADSSDDQIDVYGDKIIETIKLCSIINLLLLLTSKFPNVIFFE